MRDRKLIFSEAQVVTDSAACSTQTYIDLGKQGAPGSGGHNIGQGPRKFILWVTVGLAMTAGGTSLIVSLQDAAAYGGTYYDTCLITGAILAASLTAGQILMACPLPIYAGGVTPGVLDQFIRTYYTCSGTFSGGGTLNAWLDTY